MDNQAGSYFGSGKWKWDNPNEKGFDGIKGKFGNSISMDI